MYTENTVNITGFVVKHLGSTYMTSPSDIFLEIKSVTADFKELC